MRTAALLAALVVMGPGIGIGLGSGEHPGAGDAWRAKADAHLLEAYDAGQGPLVVVLAGPRVPAPAEAPAGRDAWRAHWAAASEPFLASLRGHAQRVGAEVLGEFPAVGAAFVRAPRGAVPELAARADVRLAGLDWQGATFVLPVPVPAADGPGVAVKLGETNAKIQVPDLWAKGLRGEGVKVAMIDTGIRGTHETMKFADGKTRVVQWHDATNHNCQTPCDGHGHGTHTAHTAVGGNLFNANVAEGAAPRASIIGIKALSDSGSGDWGDAMEALQKAFDLGAEVSSNSYGGSCGGGAIETGELAEALAAAGMTSVFAAGNAGPGQGTVHCPGLADRVVTVGATDINDNLASFSGRGPCTWDGATRVCPDVLAVGVNVEAAWSNCDTCYAAISGTSMSTPAVAGVVALLQQASKALRGRGLAGEKEAEVLLRHTARDLGTAGPDDDWGWGLTRARLAYDVVAAPKAVDVRAVVASGPAVMRAADEATLTFAAANLGAAKVTGRFTHRVEQVEFGPCPPACDRVAIADRTATLATGQEAYGTYRFKGAEHPPGTYRVTATFDYTYVDPADGQTKSGTAGQVGTFVLRKVVWQHARAVPAVAKAGDIILSGTTLRNVGNDNASAVRFAEDFIVKGYVPVPVVPPGVGPFGAFANPAPDRVGPPSTSPNVNTPKLRYDWTPGTVRTGEAWAAAYNFAAGQPGAYQFLGSVTYADEGGNLFVQGFLQTTTVALPA